MKFLKRILIALEFIFQVKTPINALQEKRFRYVPRVSKSVMEVAISYINKGNPERAKTTLECGVMDLVRSFPDYPWEDK